MTATDFMGTTSDPVMVSILKKGAPAPLLTFSPSSLSIFRDESALAKVVATFSECPVEKGKLIFTWKKHSETSSSDPVDSSIFQNTGAQLFVPSKTLSADARYNIEVTAHMENDPSKSSTGVFTINVNPRPLVASIRGGASISATTFRNLVLDARDSMDPDFIGKIDQEIEFEWSCQIQEGGVFSPCRERSGNEIAFSGGAVQTILTSDLFPTRADPYVFSVRVSKGSRTPAVFSIPVTVTEVNIPDVAVGSMSGQMQSDGTVKINPGDQLLVHGRCAVDAGASDTTMTLHWTFDPPIDNVFEIIPDDALTNDYERGETLLVADSQDQPAFMAGSSYVVRLLCTDADGVPAESELELSINVSSTRARERALSPALPPAHISFSMRARALT